MTPDARISRFALWLLPTAMKERYREEWEADLKEAAACGIKPSELRRAALRTACGVRLRHLGARLTGQRGWRAAVAGWLLTMVLTAILRIFMPGALFLVFVIPFVLLWVTRSGRATGMGVTLWSLLALWIIAGGVGVWMWGVAFDAHDAYLDPPAYTKATWPLLGVSALSYVLFWIVLIVSAVRQHRVRPV